LTGAGAASFTGAVISTAPRAALLADVDFFSATGAGAETAGAVTDFAATAWLLAFTGAVTLDAAPIVVIVVALVASDVVLALVLVAALAADFAAVFVRLPDDALATEVLTAEVLASEVLEEAFAADRFALGATCPDFAAPPEAVDLLAAAEDRALPVFDEEVFADPRERSGAAAAPARFVLSFCLADGIRGLLLLHPAVETG